MDFNQVRFIYGWKDYVATTVMGLKEENEIREAKQKISFWPYDEKYRVRFEIDIEAKESNMSFNLLGKDCTLSAIIFQDFFAVSFRDPGSYEGGRHMNIGRDEKYIDFNYAKNLLCAYSDSYNCTIPTDVFDFPIKAGEKPFLKDHKTEQ